MFLFGLSVSKATEVIKPEIVAILLLEYSNIFKIIIGCGLVWQCVSRCWDIMFESVRQAYIVSNQHTYGFLAVNCSGWVKMVEEKPAFLCGIICWWARTSHQPVPTPPSLQPRLTSSYLVMQFCCSHFLDEKKRF